MHAVRWRTLKLPFRFPSFSKTPKTEFDSGSKTASVTSRKPLPVQSLPKMAGFFITCAGFFITCVGFWMALPFCVFAAFLAIREKLASEEYHNRLVSFGPNIKITRAQVSTHAYLACSFLWANIKRTRAQVSTHAYLACAFS